MIHPPSYANDYRFINYKLNNTSINNSSLGDDKLIIDSGAEDDFDVLPDDIKKYISAITS